MAEEPTPPGIIDTLSEGFRSINHIVWVVLLPVAVDLFLWQGPRLSVAPVVRRVLAWYGGQANAAPTGAGEALLLNQEQVRTILEEVVVSFNLFSLLVLNIASVPSFIAGHSTARPAVAEVSGGLTFVLLVVVLILCGLLLGATYLGIIAQRVRGEQSDGRVLLSRVARYWLNIVAFVLIVIAVGVIVAFPVSAILTLVLLVSQSLGAALLLLAGAMLQVGFFLAIIYLFFLVDAIVVSGVGPLRAARNSMLVVSRNFWPALGLMLLTFLIMAGTNVVWVMLARQAWGPLPGIVGNAYVASGLTAASMLFYRDRMNLLEHRNGRTST